MSTNTQPQRIADALDLTKTPPRSPSEKLGRYILLPRTIDKYRSELAGKNGDYNWDGRLGQLFFTFKGIDPKAFSTYVATGASDDEILAWVEAHGTSRSDDEIYTWTYHCRTWSPETDEQKAYYESRRQVYGITNTTIRSWAELLDADEGRL